MELDALRSEVERLADTRVVLSSSDLDECYRWGSAIHSVLSERAARHMVEGAQYSMLKCYMSDGWSAKIACRVACQDADGNLVARVGKYRHEFVLERGLLRTQVPGTTRGWTCCSGRREDSGMERLVGTCLLPQHSLVGLRARRAPWA